MIAKKRPAGWLVEGLVIILTAILAACGDGNVGAPATPAQTPAPATGTATPTAAPASTQPGAGRTLRPTAGTLVFLRDGNLWVADLEGTTQPQAITSASVRAGYAGYVRRSDGDVDLYFVSQLGDPVVEGETYIAEFGLYSVSLPGGDPEELLRYSGRPLDFVIPSNASVAPDGKHIAYTDETGLVLLEVASGESSRLLDSGRCALPQGSISDCYGYHFVQWAPKQDVVKVQKILWEGAADVLVRPFESPLEPVDTGHGGVRSAWSPDGEKLCMSDESYAFFGPILVLDVATNELHDSTVNIDVPAQESPNQIRLNGQGCAWSPEGLLAIGYRAPLGSDVGRIAVLGGNFDVIAESEPITDLIDVADWLPDGSGVMFSRVEGSPGQRPAGVFHLRDGIVDLPFDADEVLGVIP